MVAAPMKTVRNLCHRLGHPNWMADPTAWYWKRPDGMPQGFGLGWHAHPGLANLLWLSMDLEHPPQVYDGGTNPLYTSTIMFCGTSKLRDQALLDWTSLGSLQEFHDALPATAPAGGNSLERAYPLLKLLAKRRLDAYA